VYAAVPTTEVANIAVASAADATRAMGRPRGEDRAEQRAAADAVDPTGHSHRHRAGGERDRGRFGGRDRSVADRGQGAGAEPQPERQEEGGDQQLQDARPGEGVYGDRGANDPTRQGADDQAPARSPR
jgi:hypothetical protein